MHRSTKRKNTDLPIQDLLHMRYNILFLAKWYPNKFDPQLGVFIQKHAKAISIYSNINVLYVYSDAVLTKTYDIYTSEKNGFLETVVCFKKDTSFFKAFINSYRYLKANLKGIRKAQSHLGVIDLIHVNILNRTGLIALIVHYFKGIPYIVTEHWTGYVSGIYQKKSFVKKHLTKKIIRHAKAVTTVSEPLKEKMLELGLVNKYIVVPNVIEQVELERRNNDNQKVKILTIGDLLDAHKNISGIIKAIAKISPKIPNIEYHIIGDGPDKNILVELSNSLLPQKNIITFHGKKTNEFVYSFLKQIDFVIINSNYETFSVVAAEALVNGKPVISTLCGGPEEFLTNEYGILIEKGNQEQLEEAILKMTNSYTSYDSIKANQYISQKFSSELIGKKFHEIYQSIITSFTIGLSGKKMDIDPSWNVLDVGSGHRPNRRANVLIDNELEETEHRSGKKASIPTDKKMVIADASNMPFKEKEFDFVIASHIAEHIDDPEKFCSELVRVGKRGYIETPGPVDEFFLNEPFHKWIVTKNKNELVFTRKNHFKPFSSLFYGLYYLNENRSGHKPFYSNNWLVKKTATFISKIWRFIPSSYTRFYWENTIHIKVIDKKND